MNKRNTPARSKMLKNFLTDEVWYCENYNQVKYIDGVEFITVCKQPGDRTFLMAKNSLKPYLGS